LWFGLIAWGDGFKYMRTILKRSSLLIAIIGGMTGFNYYQARLTRYHLRIVQDNLDTKLGILDGNLDTVDTTLDELRTKIDDLDEKLDPPISSSFPVSAKPQGQEVKVPPIKSSITEPLQGTPPSWRPEVPSGPRDFQGNWLARQNLKHPPQVFSQPTKPLPNVFSVQDIALMRARLPGALKPEP
jgi:hypothetical protein